MSIHLNRKRRFVLWLGIILTTACTFQGLKPLSEPIPAPRQLPANEQIAGEILAYLMEVVLGRAGAPEKREAWATRGQDLALDFDMVSERMFGPARQRAGLMVMDTNILGLSEVLYHYDPRLNLFKGEREHDSLYPCVELMAIRLLLLQKIRRNETVSISGMVRHSELFAESSRDAVGAELTAMKLTATEFRFLKATFQSEPAFLRYMRHPFIVSTLKKVGVAEADAFTLSADLAATYSQISCPPQDRRNVRKVTIAVLPAMNPMFTVNADTNRVRPQTEYLELQEQVKSAVAQKVERQNGPDSASDRLAFFTPERPVTIHPGNADQVIGQLCPDTAVTVILMGKNVYRAVFINAETDVFPAKNFVYMDVSDVRYHQIDDEIDAVVAAVLPALAAAGMPRTSTSIR
jgi:hypothetical protein